MRLACRTVFGFFYAGKCIQLFFGVLSAFGLSWGCRSTFQPLFGCRSAFGQYFNSVGMTFLGRNFSCTFECLHWPLLLNTTIKKNLSLDTACNPSISSIPRVLDYYVMVKAPTLRHYRDVGRPGKINPT